MNTKTSISLIILSCFLHLGCAEQESPKASQYEDYQGGGCQMYPEPSPDYREDHSTTMSGIVSFQELAPDLSKAKFFVLINEIDDSGISKRIIEQEIPINGHQSSRLNNEQFSGGLILSNILEFDFSYNHPDARSQYQFGLMIDINGDDQPSVGDFISRVPETISAGQTIDGIRLEVDQVLNESVPLLLGSLSFPDSAVLSAESVVTVQVLDVTNPEAQRVVAESVYKDMDVLPSEFEIFAYLPSNRAQYVVEVSFDSNGDQILGIDDAQSEQVAVLTFGGGTEVDLVLQSIIEENELIADSE